MKKLSRFAIFLLCLPLVGCSTNESNSSTSSSSDPSQPSSEVDPGEDTTTHYENLVINEICSKNRYSFLDKYEEQSDWIEIYNKGTTDVDLKGCGITNNDAEPYLFTFESYVLKANSYLVLVASGRLNKVYNEEYHLPFTLSQNKGGTIILSSPDAKLSEVTFPTLKDDISYGLLGEEYATLLPSPGKANESVYVEKQTLEAPTFSKKSGLYDDEFDLSISGPEGATIYYSLDCSTPTTSSTQFTDPIRVSDPSSNPNVIASLSNICGTYTPYVPDSPVNKCFVVRAIAVDDNGNYSPVSSASYWINQSGFLKSGMPITSICTDYDNLFGDEKGIYCRGKIWNDWANSDEYNPSMDYPMQPANYRQKGFEWERKSNITYLENNKVKCEQTVGIRIKGNFTRGLAKKSFNLYSRIMYDGNNKFTFKFNGKKVDKIGLRSGGNNYNYPIADMLNSEIAKNSNLNLDTQNNKATYLFLNGEFWGLYFYCDSVDSSFIENRYANADDPIIYKDTDIEEGYKTDISIFENMRNIVSDSTLSEEEYVAKVSEIIYVPSLIDTVLYHFIVGVGDFVVFSYNSASWLNRNEYDQINKIRFILYDTDWFGEDMDALFEQYKESMPVLFSNQYFQVKMFKRAHELTGLLSDDSITTYLSDAYSNYLDVMNQNNVRFFGETDAGKETLFETHKSCFKNRPLQLENKLLELIEA